MSVRWQLLVQFSSKCSGAGAYADGAAAAARAAAATAAATAQGQQQVQQPQQQQLASGPGGAAAQYAVSAAEASLFDSAADASLLQGVPGLDPGASSDLIQAANAPLPPSHPASPMETGEGQ